MDKENNNCKHHWLPEHHGVDGYEEYCSICGAVRDRPRAVPEEVSSEPRDSVIEQKWPRLPMAPSVSTEREGYDREHHVAILRSDLYAFLSDHGRHILGLLFDQKISVGKAAEALAELKLGFTPRLPAPSVSTEGEKNECPVCYYALQDAPSGYNICPRCGTEFENDDEFSTHAELREKWIRGGCKFWQSSASPVTGAQGEKTEQFLTRTRGNKVSHLQDELFAMYKRAVELGEQQGSKHAAVKYALDVALYWMERAKRAESASPVTGAHPEPTDFASWWSLPDVGAQSINNTRLRNVAQSAWEKATEIAHREMADAVCDHLSVVKSNCDCKFHRAIASVTGAQGETNIITITEDVQIGGSIAKGIACITFAGDPESNAVSLEGETNAVLSILTESVQVLRDMQHSHAALTGAPDGEMKAKGDENV